MKLLFPLLFIFIAGLAQATENLAGFVEVDADRTARVYFSKPLPPTSSVFIQWPDAKNRPHCCIKIARDALEKTSRKPASGQIMDAEDGEIKITGYRIKSGLPTITTSDSDDFFSGFLGMAVAAELVTASSPYLLQAQTRGKKMTVSTCFGSEGLNLIAKEDKARQTLYMHFDEDIDEKPKCK